MKKQHTNVIVQQQEADNMLRELMNKAYKAKWLYPDTVDVVNDEVIINHSSFKDGETEV